MTSRPRRCAVVDRDATLIDVVRDEETGVISVAFHPTHLRLLPGVIEGLKTLVLADYVIAIATNQPGPAKGQMSMAAVDRTNDALVELLQRQGIPIASVEVCPHHPVGGPGGDQALIRICDCRKPAPEMLNRALKKLDCKATNSWMVGDSLDDLRAARAAGVRAALVFPKDRCQLCPLRAGPTEKPDAIGARFDEVVNAMLALDGSTT